MSELKANCGECVHWNTTGFGTRDTNQVFGVHRLAVVGKCERVAKNWYPYSEDRPIALNGIEHTRWPVSELISVITRREFGCNQFKQRTTG